MGYYDTKDSWTSVPLKEHEKKELKDFRDSLGAGTSYREAITELLEAYDE